MILIDQPYISDFLIKTIKENNIEIISTSAAREMVSDNSLNWISEEDAINNFKTDANSLLLSISENAISWIEKNLGFTNLPNQINLFKNKIRFRELLKDAYPNYFFKGIKFEELKQFKSDDFKFPFILKPAVGFFSVGVYKVDSFDEWNQTIDKIELDIEKIKGSYPKEVVDVSEFIIEEIIGGEEYAIDCYFDHHGEPIILNIFHHIFSSNDDLSDRIYSSSKEIIESLKDKSEEFLKLISAKTNLKNFPAHIEIRIDNDGNINPIEVNPLRFGGWCTTGDLSWFAYGFNSYEYFLKGKKPDWDSIFKTRKGKKYSIVVLDNTSGYSADEIEFFNYDLLLKDFDKPLDLRKVNMKGYPIFGFLFTETSADKEAELVQILNSNLRKYIKLK
ncbi:MAG: ATP-grasp domain-containing protein [Bacteroidetes bacterium]|nr:ATP-grasp domain-containing protein [Bacteroidota bacterium]